MESFLCIIILIVLVCSTSIEGLFYNETEFLDLKSGCSELPVDPSLNMTWLRSVDYWNIPVWSKHELFLTIKLSTTPEEFAEITEDDVKNSCYMISSMKEDKSNVSFYGLNRKFFEWESSLRYNRDGIIDWFISNEYVATSYIVLTDNKNYFLGIEEIVNAPREYFVAAKSDNIPLGEIYEKIESLGFPKSSEYPVKSDCDEDKYLKQIKGQLR